MPILDFGWIDRVFADYMEYGWFYLETARELDYMFEVYMA